MKLLYLALFSLASLVRADDVDVGIVCPLAVDDAFVCPKLCLPTTTKTITVTPTSTYYPPCPTRIFTIDPIPAQTLNARASIRPVPYVFHLGFGGKPARLQRPRDAIVCPPMRLPKKDAITTVTAVTTILAPCGTQIYTVDPAGPTIAARYALTITTLSYVSQANVPSLDIKDADTSMPLLHDGSHHPYAYAYDDQASHRGGYPNGHSSLPAADSQIGLHHSSIEINTIFWLSFEYEGLHRCE
ncbi:hypothetical protein PIIN_03861 [Serendipita indica DSM 11827]|uniref:Uncharacterized protein n=1 Tax=Serendipita indica (strain DSM 11827) TaxID=1109443 RepID=G4TF44_SERID|nr:hypothetical protein PIIN_03861 [Serendipita indica DSM 11827]